MFISIFFSSLFLFLPCFVADWKQATKIWINSTRHNKKATRKKNRRHIKLSTKFLISDNLATDDFYRIIPSKLSIFSPETVQRYQPNWHWIKEQKKKKRRTWKSDKFFKINTWFWWKCWTRSCNNETNQKLINAVHHHLSAFRNCFHFIPIKPKEWY